MFRAYGDQRADEALKEERMQGYHKPEPTKLEQVAQAIYERRVAGFSLRGHQVVAWCNLPEDQRANEIAGARAAIEALKYKHMPSIPEGAYWPPAAEFNAILDQMSASLKSSPAESAPAWSQITPDPVIWQSFNDREQSIYREICRGEKDKQIARTLNVSPHLIQWYLRQMYKSTGAKTRTELLVIVGRLAPPPAPAPETQIVPVAQIRF